MINATPGTLLRIQLQPALGMRLIIKELKYPEDWFETRCGRVLVPTGIADPTRRAATVTGVAMVVDITQDNVTDLSQWVILLLEDGRLAALSQAHAGIFCRTM